MRLRSALFLGLCVGCVTPAHRGPRPDDSGSPPGSAHPPASGPLAAQEHPSLTKHALAAPGGAFTGEVEAAGPPTFEQGKGYTRLSIPLGTGEPLRCDVYAEPLDTGGALWRVVQALGKQVDIQRLRTTDVLPISEAPALFMEVQYRTGAEPDAASWRLELMVHASPTLPLLCAHAEAGPSGSFQRITRALAESLRLPHEAPAPPRYAELHVIRLEGQPVGFERRTLEDAEGGRRVAEIVYSLLLPRSPKELLTHDMTTVELLDAEGKVVAKDYARALNGELRTRVSLEHVQGAEYRYEGQHGGKSVSGKLTLRQGLSSRLGVARAVREQLLSGKVQELRFDVYEPTSEPAAMLPLVWRKPSAEGRDVTLELGSQQASATLDAQGMVERMELSVGEVRLTQERLTVRGTP